MTATAGAVGLKTHRSYRWVSLIAVALASSVPVSTASAQTTDPAQPSETGTTSLFGWELQQNERFRNSGTFIAGWSHDGAQASLGFEKQGRVAEANGHYKLASTMVPGSAQYAARIRELD